MPVEREPVDEVLPMETLMLNRPLGVEIVGRAAEEAMLFLLAGA